MGNFFLWRSCLTIRQRTEVLKSNGTESEVIKILLRDARLLGWLSKLLEDQMLTLKTLERNYTHKNWSVLHEQDKDKTETVIRKFGKEIDSLAEHMHHKLGDLTSKSQDLIQLVKQSVLNIRFAS